MKLPSTESPEVRSNGRPGDDEGCLWLALYYEEALSCWLIMNIYLVKWLLGSFFLYTELLVIFIKFCPNCSQQ